MKPIRELNPQFLESKENKQHLIDYLLGVADNYLILAQRLGELCGHGPNLEPDIAITNISLDLLGQVRSFYQYISQLKGDGSTEDDIAFLRKEREYRSVLLVQQPNTDFAYVIARQFFFDVYNKMFLNALQQSADETLRALAFKGIKEASYHERFSGDWLKRLGDGTEESHDKAQKAVNDLWVFTDELFQVNESDSAMIDAGVAPDMLQLREYYYEKVENLLTEATLEVPEVPYFQKGGKNGLHSEYMGYILAEMQYMQRTYPNSKW
ncbi:phenylacetic acid degradation protein [Nonlabens sp. MIC269]|uniref:1,2-phenylacetyl-CoA epoxidase subunit PaaC n=1 Tax=Nonlabens TaxID=363408 RepID=UPI000721BE03|nr:MULTISPECIES: 1,2-phenylacetyl-CoA epoxidase subunit PaaC [Nonlabens]ALM21606.1 phenylacetic acid degradation protein [Nonlabens sp. MIC269]ARN71668.1 phenylacetate-CoA oxygenase subunit PaaI [Nonlabens tegetincola]